MVYPILLESAKYILVSEKKWYQYFFQIDAGFEGIFISEELTLKSVTVWLRFYDC